MSELMGDGLVVNGWMDTVLGMLRSYMRVAIAAKTSDGNLILSVYIVSVTS